jgi:hypothetical protein
MPPATTHLCRAGRLGKQPGMTPGNRKSSDERHETSAHGEVVEPPNSTVDDWLGQQASKDEEVVDELLDETGGDIDEAERRFPERSHQDRPGRLPTDRRRT